MRVALIVWEAWYGPVIHMFPGKRHSDKVLDRKANRWAELNLSAEEYERCSITVYENVADIDTARKVK